MTIARQWYAMADLPRGRVRVRVRWTGYEVEATSTVDAKGVRHWHEVACRELRPLAAVPVAWQPLPSVGWAWPNGVEPEPLPVLVVPRMCSEEATFDAVAAAEEMEAEREDARANHGREPADDGGQWWRDVARVAYEPMGSVSREMGEARVLRHLILERSLPMDIKRQRSNAAVLAALKLTMADIYGDVPDADWVPPLVAQPEDHRDFETVMGWLSEVGTTKRELNILRSRMLAPPATWVQIGDRFRISRQRARQVYDGAIDDLVEAANRPPRRAVARLAELRERNREARRQ